jgi:hypothetical protein
VFSSRMVACSKPYGVLWVMLVLAVASGAWAQGDVYVGSGPGQLSSGVVVSSAAASVTSVSGQVINAMTGQPIVRALVKLNDRGVLTDHDGKFRFDQVSGDGANVEVSKPGFYASVDPSDGAGVYLRAAQMSVPLVLRMYPEALLIGTVTGPDGSPIPHIPVSAERSVFYENGHRWNAVDTVVTDARGNFRLTVSSGDYRLVTRFVPRGAADGEAVLPVRVPDGSSSNGSGVIRVHSGEEQHFDLRPAVRRTHTVRATMETRSERGFPNITARSSDGSTIQANVMRSGASGETRIELPSGTYTLNAVMNGPDGIEQAETRVTVGDQDVTGVVFRFSPIAAVPVEMLIDDAATSDNSQPNLQQFGLMLQNSQSDSERGDGTVGLATQRDHSFAFSVPPGSYRLEARSGGGEWYVKSASFGATDLLTQDLVVGVGAGGAPIRVTISNQTASLQGMVKMNGAAADCWVYLVPTSPSAEMVFTSRSNVEGGYTFTHLPPGSYQAIAFERRHSVDYRDPAAFAGLSTHVRSITVNVGEKPSLDLDAVSAAELVP